MLELLNLCALQARVGCEMRSAILVLFATCGAALVAMQPGAISPKRDEISEWEFVVVKVSDHRSVNLPMSSEPCLAPLAAVGGRH